MRFTKMHGIGNDYVYVNCLEENIKNPEQAAKFVSDRHFGIGSDGLILIKPSSGADFLMEMYNSDGSRGKMCGNGIRCVAKYVYDYGLTDKTRISVDTSAGVKSLELHVWDGKVNEVKVDMGEPDLTARNIPVITDGETAINAPITAGGQSYRMTCVSMGNPHCVIFMDEAVSGLDLMKLGPDFEMHARFPERINTEFIHVADPQTLLMRVWERGSGETLACGTGACAAAVAAILNGYTQHEVTVKLLGGDLLIEWNKENNHVFMTGGAQTVFDGEITLPE